MEHKLCSDEKLSPECKLESFNICTPGYGFITGRLLAEYYKLSSYK